MTAVAVFRCRAYLTPRGGPLGRDILEVDVPCTRYHDNTSRQGKKPGAVRSKVAEEERGKDIKRRNARGKMDTLLLGHARLNLFFFLLSPSPSRQLRPRDHCQGTKQALAGLTRRTGNCLTWSGRIRLGHFPCQHTSILILGLEIILLVRSVRHCPIPTFRRVTPTRAGHLPCFTPWSWESACRSTTRARARARTGRRCAHAQNATAAVSTRVCAQRARRPPKTCRRGCLLLCTKTRHRRRRPWRGCWGAVVCAGRRRASGWEEGPVSTLWLLMRGRFGQRRSEWPQRTDATAEGGCRHGFCILGPPHFATSLCLFSGHSCVPPCASDVMSFRAAYNVQSFGLASVALGSAHLHLQYAPCRLTRPYCRR